MTSLLHLVLHFRPEFSMACCIPWASVLLAAILGPRELGTDCEPFSA